MSKSKANLLSKLAKEVATHSIKKFSEHDIFWANEWFSTGSPGLDKALGTFGFPRGIIEIAGKSRSGKTTLGLSAMAHFMKTHGEDAVPIILSTEMRDNKDYAQRMGIDPEKVFYYASRFIEDIFLTLSEFVDKIRETWDGTGRKPKIFVLWDSIGATLTRADMVALEENKKTIAKINSEYEDENERREALEGMKMKETRMGAFAKEGKRFAKYIQAIAYSMNMTLVCINHTYDKMDGRPGQQSGGGKWVEYFPTIRLRMSMVATEKIDDIPVAQISRVKMVKNDFGPCVDYDIRLLLGKHLILSDDEIEMAIDAGLVEKESVKKRSFGPISWNSKRTFFNLYAEGTKSKKIITLLHKQLYEYVVGVVTENRKN